MIFDSHLKLFVEILFPQFPRDVGFPSRVSFYEDPPRNFSELYQKVQYHHSKSPSFIQLYDTKLQQKIEENVVDKIWIDLDGSNYYGVYHDLKLFYERTKEEFEVDINHFFPVFTGGKGFHNYIINEERETTSDEIELVLQYLTRDLEYIDTVTFTDLNRMVRLAGVQRPNSNFCFAIDPIDLFEKSMEFNDLFKQFNYDWLKLFDHCTSFLKLRKESGYVVGNVKTDYISAILETIQDKGWEPEKKKTQEKYDSLKQSSDNQNYNPRDAVHSFLLEVLGKEIYSQIIIENPLHLSRVRYARKLLGYGLSVSTIVTISSKLNWVDFNPNITYDFVQDLKNRYL